MNIREIVDKYLQEKGRIGVKLSVLLYNLQGQRHPFELLKGLWKQGDDILRLLKIIILIHQCFQQGTLPAEQTIDLLAVLTNRAAQSFKRRPDKFQEHLFGQGVQPYALYLQKKLQNLDQPDLDKESLLYKDLNLLKRGVGFAEILHTFGRYFQKSHGFFVDFNIILAKEASQLYHILLMRIGRCKHLYDSFLRLELQRVHEKMYIIFYNAYFHREVRDYVPTWLNTQQTKNLEQPCRSDKKSLQKKHSLPNKNSQSFTYRQSNGFLTSRKKTVGFRKNSINFELNSTNTGLTDRENNLHTSRLLKGEKSFTQMRGIFHIYYDEQDEKWPGGKNNQNQEDQQILLIQKERIQLMKSMQGLVLNMEADITIQ